MKPETELDFVVFQLTPTRTRCELVITANGETEKLASGLFQPFVTHLKTAADQIAKGGYSIRLEPPHGSQDVCWFTKGTLERFVRFVSTPEIVERINTIESEIAQIEEAISSQCGEAIGAEEHSSKSGHDDESETGRSTVVDNSESALVLYEPKQSNGKVEAAHAENSKLRLLKLLETRRMVLQKEQGMAFARAAAAGFDIENMRDLVLFSECFGAFRLREACFKFMELWKKKQEAGLWLEEMELEAMETNSMRSESCFVNETGITLNSSVYALKPRVAQDAQPLVAPSESGDLKSWKSVNSEDFQAKYQNGVSTDNTQVHYQNPALSPWQGQQPPYGQNFHPPGFPYAMQGVPYYPGYAMNPSFYQGMQHPMSDDHAHIPLYPQYSASNTHLSEESRRGSNKRAESHRVATSKAKHPSINGDRNSGSETSESDNSDFSGESDNDEHMENLQTRSSNKGSSSYKKGPSKQGNKQSGRVFIRNINYITSDKHGKGTGLEDYDPEVDVEMDEEHKDKASDVHLHVKEVINIFEKKSKDSDTKKKGQHASELTVATENNVNADAENEGWNIFQQFLVRDDEPSENVTGSISFDEELDPKTKEQKVENEVVVLPERRESIAGDSLDLSNSEQQFTLRNSSTMDDFIIQREMTSYDTNNDHIFSHVVEYDTNKEDPFSSLQQDSNAQTLGDDSFMISTMQDEVDTEWKTVMNIDSEVLQTAKSDNIDGMIQSEPAELFMMPERLSEMETSQWDPAADYERQANMFEEKAPATGNNDSVDEMNSSKIDMPAKNQPKKKISEKEARLKAMQEALEKRKAAMASRNAKQGKPNPLAEAQMRAEKLRAFKASLQKTKKEMEEEERKRLEGLKIQRQKRIAARRSLSPTSSTSSRSTKPLQQRKSLPSSNLLSPSSRKANVSRSLSPGGSFPASTSRTPNATKLQKQNSSSQIKQAENSVSKSVASISEIKKEKVEVIDSGSKKGTSTRKTNEKVGAASKSGKESAASSLDRLSRPTGRVSDGSVSSDAKKRSLPARRHSLEVESKDKVSKGSSGSDSSLQKPQKTATQSLNRAKINNSDAHAGKRKTKALAKINTTKKSVDEDIIVESSEKVRINTSEVECLAEQAGVGSNVASENASKAGAGPGCIPIRAPASFSTVNSFVHDRENSSSEPDYLNDQEAENVRVLIRSPEGYEANNLSPSVQVASDSSDSNIVHPDVERDVPSLVSHSNKVDEPYRAPVARMSSFDEPSVKSRSNDTSQPPKSNSESNGSFIIREPISETNQEDAPLQSESQSSLQNLTEVENKSSSARDSHTITHQSKSSSAEKTKENSKGFKRLLKFGKKSNSSSVTSENEDSHSKTVTGSATETQVAHSLGSLISQEETEPGSNPHKVSRSFFSLATFRSKGSDARSK